MKKREKKKLKVGVKEARVVVKEKSGVTRGNQ